MRCPCDPKCNACAGRCDPRSCADAGFCLCCRHHDEHDTTRWQRYRDDSIRKVPIGHRCEMCGRDNGPGVDPYEVSYPTRGCQGCGA